MFLSVFGGTPPVLTIVLQTLKYILKTSYYGGLAQESGFLALNSYLVACPGNCINVGTGYTCKPSCTALGKSVIDWTGLRSVF